MLHPIDQGLEVDVVDDGDGFCYLKAMSLSKGWKWVLKGAEDEAKKKAEAEAKKKAAKQDRESLTNKSYYSN